MRIQYSAEAVSAYHRTEGACYARNTHIPSILRCSSLNLHGRSFKLRKISSFHFPPIRDTAVATGHSGNSSFARIILTSESIVTHSILSVQLQKGAYLFLYVSHTILIPSNQKLQINYGGYYGKLHKNNYWKGKPN